MLKYLLLAIIGLLIFLAIIKNVYLYGQGKYHPNGKYDSFKSRLVNAFFLGIFVFSLHLMTYYIRLEGISTDFDFAVTFLALSYLLCVNTLNYLCYKRLRERKTIYISLLLNLAVISLWYAITYFL